MVTLFFNFKGTSILFSIVAAPRFVYWSNGWWKQSTLLCGFEDELMCENYSQGVWCIHLCQNHPKYNKWMSEGRKATWAMLVIAFKSNLWYQSLLLYDQFKMTQNKTSTNQILWLISVHAYYCAFLIVSSLFVCNFLYSSFIFLTPIRSPEFGT